MVSVGTPRFYVNVMEWLYNVNSLTDSANLDMVLMNPSNILTVSGDDWDGDNDVVWHPELTTPLSGLIGDKGFVAHLGHNYADCELKVRKDQGTPYGTAIPLENIVNADILSESIQPEYNGFSIYLADYSNQNVSRPRLRYDYVGDSGDPYNGLDVKVGSVILGSYYDMPNAPNLSLTMSLDYGSTREFSTYNGSSMSNTMVSKCPKWGDFGAWELTKDYGTFINVADGHPSASRSGRRSWNLKFSQIDSSDLWGPNQMLSFIRDDISDGTDSDDYNDSTKNFNSNLTTDDNFFSQVWNKTLGMTLPMIMQIDNTNNSPDQFAIVKGVANSLKATQSSYNVYDISVSIEEAW